MVWTEEDAAAETQAAEVAETQAAEVGDGEEDEQVLEEEEEADAVDEQEEEAAAGDSDDFVEAAAAQSRRAADRLRVAMVPDPEGGVDLRWWQAKRDNGTWADAKPTPQAAAREALNRTNGS